MATHTNLRQGDDPWPVWHLRMDLDSAPVQADMQTIVLNNTDNTFTVIHGNGFTFDPSGNPAGGTITEIEHVTGFGPFDFALEQIADFTVSLVDFFSGDSVSAFRLILAGADTFNGSDAYNSFYGSAGADVYNGGTGSLAIDTLCKAAMAMTCSLGASVQIA